MLDFERLQTPSNDGDVLIEPSASQWADILQANRQAAAAHTFTLAGQPIRDVRTRVRQRILSSDTQSPIISAGHQPEFIHPGVWAKHVVVHHVAETLGATGVDLIVDSDVPNNTALRVPRKTRAGLYEQAEIHFVESTTGSAFEGMAGISAERIDHIASQLKTTLGATFEQSLLPVYLDGLKAADASLDWVTQHVISRNAIDASLRADLAERRISEHFGGAFVAEILLNAARFRDAYNHALAKYRTEQRIRGAQRPLPDLALHDDRVETPLWIGQRGRGRIRLFVASKADQLDLFADRRHIGTLAANDLRKDPDAAIDSLSPWLLRPRALTLTLWARLVMCDLFVHGIGGAKYDRVTDDIIRRYFHIEPPAYACVTATLRLPITPPSASQADLIAAHRAARDVRYNPHRYVNDVPADWLAQREALIRTSNQLRVTQGDPVQRRNTFRAIRAHNARLADANPDVINRLQHAVATTHQARASIAVSQSREYFYALQPRERLVELADRLIDAAQLS